MPTPYRRPAWNRLNVLDVEGAPKLPRKGWKSITVRDEIYDYFMREWRRGRTEHLKRGVTSFSGFVTQQLSELMEKEKREKKRTSHRTKNR